MSSDTDVKALVRERYAEVAKAAGGCCADDVCGTPTQLYDSGQIDGLPSEALMASAGCGNPTAIDDLKPGDTVVDFGSGGGIDCFIAAKAVGEQGRVIGVDMTPDMVDLARRNAASLGMTNVTFHLTEMENTPVAADSADVIISNCVINLAPDKDAVFREAYRLLKPGGRMFISDMLLTAPLPEYAVADSRNWVACLSGAEPQDVYLGRMRQAGFERMQIMEDKPWQGEQEWASRVHSMNIKAYKPV